MNWPNWVLNGARHPRALPEATCPTIGFARECEEFVEDLKSNVYLLSFSV